MTELFQIPALRDNYIYLGARAGEAFVVDPPDAEGVLAFLRDRGWQLRALLCTHHHADHTGANLALRRETGCDVIGAAHDAERIPALTQSAVPGHAIHVADWTFRVLDVRGHTRGHIAYALDEPLAGVIRHGHGGIPLRIERLAGRPALFVGDALFLGGCGRLFEGDAVDLARALRVLAAESDEALVCCAHEYTEGNLAFAASVLPSVAEIALRKRDLPWERGPSGSSVPDTLGRERLTNPFLRCLDERLRGELAERLALDADASEETLLGALRSAKDHFRGA